MPPGVGAGVPDGFRGEREAALPLDLVVVHGEPDDAVAVAFEQGGFGFEDHVFAAALLVVVMDDENRHASEGVVVSSCSSGVAGPNVR